MRSYLGLASLALFAIGCGEVGPDFSVNGVGVVVDTSAPFSKDPTFRQHFEKTVSAALVYWGSDWAALSGHNVIFVEGPWLTCGGAPYSTGCYNGDIRVVSSDPVLGPLSCVEQTVLVHEIGHAIIGDFHHRDPRWMDFDSLKTLLSEEAPGCNLIVNVWQHPPN